jgi:hypothetical protein
MATPVTRTTTLILVKWTFHPSCHWNGHLVIGKPGHSHPLIRTVDLLSTKSNDSLGIDYSGATAVSGHTQAKTYFPFHLATLSFNMASHDKSRLSASSIQAQMLHLNQTTNRS